MSEPIQPNSDPDQAHPVPICWRSTVEAIVKTLADGDFDRLGSIPGMVEVDDSTQSQVRDYIADYGEALAPLQPETWASSVVQWYGPHWQVLVDLWTVESGESDMVLDLRVTESGDGYEFEIHAVYVP